MFVYNTQFDLKLIVSFIQFLLYLYMGFKQDSLQASKYLGLLEELLNDSDVQKMKLELINDLKLLGGRVK